MNFNRLFYYYHIMINKKCEKLPAGGFMCHVNNHDLNNIKKNHNLTNLPIKSNGNRSKLDFMDNSGNVIATAIKMGNSDIRLFSLKNFDF